MSRNSVAISSAELRQFLLKTLPEYSIPSHFVLLDELPLSVTGKVDRQALISRKIDSLHDEDYVAPRTPLEEQLCVLWSEVLDVSSVGIHDNFFVLGGHSLSGVRLIAKLQDAGFNVSLGRIMLCSIR